MYRFQYSWVLVLALTGFGSAIACNSPRSNDGSPADATGGSSSAPSESTPCVIRVSANDGNDKNTGESWSAALKTLQAALNKAEGIAGFDVCVDVEVWVAEGIYIPTRPKDANIPRSATFELIPNVSLFGGFVGKETARSERDFESHVTVLSGDLGTANDPRDNSFHVVIGATGATLDGFVITGGNASGTSVAYGADKNGGGMLNFSVSPLVTNCTFIDNHAGVGGAVYNQFSSATIMGCHFLLNSAARGGAVFNSSYKNPHIPTFRDCTFAENFADEGGAIANVWVRPMITNSVFLGNIATRGGAISNVVGWPSISNCLFLWNVANSGGAIWSFNYSSPKIANCTFAENAAKTGSALYNTYIVSPTVTNSIFWNMLNAESAPDEIYNDSSSVLTGVSYSIVRGGYPDGTNIIDKDPLFADPAKGDFTLKIGSPALDSGNGCSELVTLTDLNHRPRWDVSEISNAVNGGPVDMGALEYQGKAGTDTLLTEFACPTVVEEP
jgi:hypothetical protein